MPHSAIVFLAGLIVVVVGAELVLRAATRMAAILRAPPILIGLTVVSLGTSVPELAIGVTAAAEGRGALAVGNITGANIFNILFILGLSAWIRPLPMRMTSIRLNAPMMAAAALALIVMAWDGVLGRAEGFVLLAGAVAYTVALIRLSRRESAATQREFAEEYGADALMPASGATVLTGKLSRGVWYGLVLGAGVVVTAIGADLLVAGAVDIARAFGVSDAFIGLTIVTFGTSSPELATTAVATLRNDRDVAVGNLIGSSSYNILVILGLTCLVAPAGIEVSRDILRFDLPLAAATALVCLPVFRSGQTVSRREGAMFVLAYLAYLASLLYFRA